MDEFGSDIPRGMQGQYNQALFQQIRLHELWTRIERMSINPLLYNPEFKLYHYEVMFNDLGNILKVVYPKLTSTDQEAMLKDRDELQELIKSKPIYQRIKKFNKIWTRFDKEAWTDINDKLFNFMLKIEVTLDKHGLGNPNKDDPNKAILRM